MNTDLISRADAEALFRTARSKLNPSDYKTADEFNTRDLMLLNAEQMIHLLPSVTPKQRLKNGETDENGNAEYMCSECTHGDVHAETQIVPFCWWCGTRMVEPQESEDKE